MSKVLVLYYSMYGHIEAMAKAVAEGAASVPGATVVVKRVPELMDAEFAKSVGAKVDQDAEIASPQELGEYDAIILGTPTRFGNMAAQMRNFLDQTGGLWVKGGLDGKIGSAFTCTGTGSGNESTILTVINTFIHHGMLISGLSPQEPGLKEIDKMRGGSVYGAGSIASPNGQRMPSEVELSMARNQGQRVAEFATRLFG